MQISSKPKVAIAIPAFNEADGITEFLTEIDAALRDHVRELCFVVVDDASTDDTAGVTAALPGTLNGSLELIRSAENRGHGPALMEAYRRSLELQPDYVLQVDGDGQFHGTDLRRVLVLLLDDARAVCGVRRFRHDPWFRMIMTRLVRGYVGWMFGVRARDPNCPLRGYEPALLEWLLDAVPDGSRIPNLYLTIIAARRGVSLLEVDVSHRVRRGGSPQGTTWRSGVASPIPWRLVRFSAQAFRESVRFRRQMAPSGWARQPRLERVDPGGPSASADLGGMAGTGWDSVRARAGDPDH